MKTNDFITTEVGLRIYKDEQGYSITGFPKKEIIAHDYDSAYDFEDCVRRNVNCDGIEFDSEFCQFWAYAKTKGRLVKFADDIHKHYVKAKKTMEGLY
jgi:hypothetical protein